MTAPYKRTRHQRAHDFQASKAFEDEVRKVMPSATIVRTDSTTELDFFVPGLYLDVKEKRQKLTQRWHLLDDVEEVDLFVLDELSIRKALVHAPYSYFLLRDVPGGGRLFLANAVETAVGERVRRNRVGKGKWIISLRQFRELNSLEELMPAIAEDVAAQKWKESGCLSAEEVAQV